MITITWLAALSAALAVWQLTSPGTSRRRLQTLNLSAALDASAPSAAVRAPGRRPVQTPVFGYLARLLWGGSKSEERRRAAVRELCFAVACELRSGRPPAEALRHATATQDADGGLELVQVSAAADSGGDTVAALRNASAWNGAEGLRRLAACWQVGAGSGAGFAQAVERLAETLRAEEHQRREVVAHLAGPRSTTRLLAALPLLGLALSAAMGMRPFEFLLGTSYGLTCLLLGVSLDVLGVAWTRRLAQRAQERR